MAISKKDGMMEVKTIRISRGSTPLFTTKDVNLRILAVTKTARKTDKQSVVKRKISVNM